MILKDLIIIGASGFGREVAWLVERINKVEKTWNLLGFLDDNKEMWGITVDGYLVIGGTELSTKYRNSCFVCAIGTPSIRKKVIQKMNSITDFKYAVLIDPSVCTPKLSQIGKGSIICAGSILTTDITVGEHVIMNLDCTVGHDTVIGNFVSLCPSVNVSGNVTIEAEAEIGTGVQIIQGKKIGKGSIIGAGAVVVRDIPAKCVAVGNPAKPMRFFE